MIVVNDGSTDGSAAVLADAAAAEPRLRVVTHEQNRGYGGALLSGFAAATKQWVFYTDGDGQFDPAELELLVAARVRRRRRRAGLQAAPRRQRRPPGRRARVPPVRALVFGLKIRDTDCDFRLIRRLDARPRSQLVHTTGRDLRRAGAQAAGRRRAVHRGAACTTTGGCTASRSSSTSPAWRARCRDLAGLWFRLVVFRRGDRPASGGTRREDEHGAAERHGATP